MEHNLKEMFSRREYIQPNFYFYMHYGKIPDKLIYQNLNFKSCLETIIKEYSINDQQINQIKYYDKPNQEEPIQRSCLVQISDELMVYFNPGIDSPKQLEVLFGKNVDQLLLNKLKEIVSANWKNEDVNANKIYLVVRESYGLDLKQFDLIKQEVGIDENYNDDIVELNSIIIQKLNGANNKGVVLLHGEPGTGKTSYIRYLTSVLNKKMIYMPSQIAHSMASPDFLQFLSEHENAILIIEDAEDLISERKPGDGGVISSLLNMTDGLLADCLKIQIICSFNTSINNIDKALLRKGRLIASYEFKQLAIDKANKLAKSLGLGITYNAPQKLTDIYNHNDISYEKAEVKLGFNR